MLLFPHAKINLGLNVVHKRPDGYHDIESVLLPIPLCDALEVIVDQDLPAGGLVMKRTGLPIPGKVGDDLCTKAIDLVRSKHVLPGLRVHLHKVIPIGAGLGGGSSDGAHMLILLDRLLDLRLGEHQVHELAMQLGSDCPFFLKKQAQLAEGRGELLQPVGIALGGWWLMLVHPGIHVSTAAAYANTAATDHSADLVPTLRLGPAAWRARLVNVMEPFIFHAHPAIAQIKHALYQQGATYASMSGSGSSVFGLFKDPPLAMAWPHGHRRWVFKL